MSYYEHSPFMQASEGAFRYGLYGFINPATLAMNDRPESMFIINDKNGNMKNSDYGFFSGNKYFGSGMIRHNINGKSFWDIRYNVGFGNRNFGIGFGYGAIAGDNPYKYNPTYQIGLMTRPNPHISLGYVFRSNFNEENNEHVAELALRPIRNYPLTAYLDAAAHLIDDYETVKWSAGLSWEILDGIRVNGRYFSDERLAIGVDISFGDFAFGTIASAPDKNGLKNATSAYSVRFSPMDRSIIYDTFYKRSKAVKMELEGSLEQESSFLNFIFPAGPYVNLYDLLEKLESMRQDKEIKEIYINITKFTANYSSMWEVRNKLDELKASGKKIIIYSEGYNIRNYHLASVADEILIEPMGEVTLEGFASARSYYKNFMEKYGIGFEEIRLFKYKSAAESFTRTDFSEGEKEQRQKLIDDMYEYARHEITQSRKISNGEFDDIVENHLFLFSEKAIEKKLVDKAYRWNKIDTLIEERNNYDIVREGMVFVDQSAKDDRWSEQDRKIAIVYAEGVCDMETGISGRKLSQIMEYVMDSRQYEGVILRVNSPGGSALASDYVADIVRRYKDRKPVVVSQGSVAASGGYWLSMDADKIVATPMTITGSIGVISSFIYNKGLMDTLGVTYDVVKRGQHSDLGSPVVTPLLPIGIPARNFTNNELSAVKSMISDFYGDFVRKVAAGRKMDSAKVGELAQGRIYSGVSAKNNNLVDEIGGLEKAIEIIKKKIKFKENDRLEVVELSPNSANLIKQAFTSVGNLFSKSKTISIIPPIIEDDLKYRLQNNGKAQFILPSDYYDLVK